MLPINEIVAEWSTDKLRFEELGEFVQPYIKSKLFEAGLFPEISFRTKDLVSIIKKIKKKKREKEYSYHHLKDKLGLRIICNYNSELLIVDEIIKANFTIIGVEYKQESLDFDKLGYTSNHYDLKIGNAEEFEIVKEASDLIFELQVRTLNQHVWSNITHELSYKQEKDLPGKLKRRVYRLLSLYEIADDEFEAVNKNLINHPDTHLFSVLKQLEPFIYRFAQIEYDRDTSVFTLKALLSGFSDQEITEIKGGIEKFVENNSSKIQNIFEENRSRFHEIPTLTQPEVFFLWYCLIHKEYVLKENWNEHFDEDELKQISNLWGTEIE